MIGDEDLPRKAPPVHQVGQDVSTLSVAELQARIDMLKGEILRLEAALAERAGVKSAADALFRF